MTEKINGGGGPYAPTSPGPQKLPANPAHTAEVEGMRHRDLKEMSKRLGRCGTWNWANVLLAFALLVVGADLGAWIAMWPYFTTTPEPTHNAKVIYIVIAAGVGLIGLVGLAGALCARHERAESVGHIKEDLDELLTAWDTTNGS